jgi:hypothetical protein
VTKADKIECGGIDKRTIEKVCYTASRCPVLQLTLSSRRRPLSSESLVSIVLSFQCLPPLAAAKIFNSPQIVVFASLSTRRPSCLSISLLLSLYRLSSLQR